ncbi:MAG: Yip1 family protein [Pseudomonadota bacterium]
MSDNEPKEHNPPPSTEPEVPSGTPPPTRSSDFDLGTVIAQAKHVLSDPRGFYREMPRSGGYSEPAIFAIIMGVGAGVVFTVLSFLGLTGEGLGGIFAIIVMPIALLIGGFIAAVVLFVIWKLMGTDQSFEASYRCVAYSYAIVPVVTLISIIPYVGTIVRTLWGIWLMIIASVEVHGRKHQTALIVFGVLGFLSLMGGLSAERGGRQFDAAVQDSARQFEQGMQPFEQVGVNEDGEFDPEQAGRAVGAFLRGMQAEVDGGTDSSTAQPVEEARSASSGAESSDGR